MSAPLRSAWLVLLLAFTALGLLPACGDKDAAQATCEAVTDCDFGESCLDGVCTSRSCATSAGCPVGSFCAGGECTSGCETTDDCYPDQVCNGEGLCADRGCRSTSLDCAFGEFCDSATGECYDAGNYYCKSCIYESSDSTQCGTSDNQCIPFGQYGDFCGVQCDATSDCPAGFDCVVLELNGQVSGQCLTYCWLYEDDDSRATARPTPPDLDHLADVCPVVAESEAATPDRGSR